MGLFGKAKGVVEAAKEYGAETQRAWRETPGNTKGLRKLEGKDKSKLTK